MNSKEMQNSFHVEFDGYQSGIHVDSEDVFYFLNKAQISFVEETFDPTDPRRNGFEQSQRVADELKTIYEKDKEINAYYAGNNSATEDFVADSVDLPADLMYIVSHRPEITYVADPSHIELNTSPSPSERQVVSGESSKTELVWSKPVQSDDIYTLLSDPFNKPKKRRPLADISDTKIDIYTDDTFFVERLFLNYIRQPKEIVFDSDGSSNNQDCELPDFVHNEIVELAVKLFLQSRGKLQNNNAN